MTRVNEPLEPLPPERWAELISRLPLCPPLPAVAGEETRVEALGITLDLPPDALPFEEDDEVSDAKMWIFPDGTTILVAMRAPPSGYPNFVFEAEGTVREVDGECRVSLDGHAAKVVRGRLRGEHSLTHLGSVESVLSSGDSLAGFAVAVTEERREQLLACLLRMRVHPR